MAYEKKFVIIGNQNALTYKEIFPPIKDNKLRCGYTSGSRTFLAPDDYPGNCFEKDGRKWVTMGNTCWFTNLDLAKSHEPLSLTEEYHLHPERYPKYDNYDAIEVPKVSLIPKDYFGVMGVPITFFDRYCSEQFEIVGLTCTQETMPNAATLGEEFVKNYRAQGGKGHVSGNMYGVCYFDKGRAKVPYGRILIRNRTEKFGT